METKTLIGLVIAILCLVIFWIAYDRIYNFNVNQEQQNVQNILDGIIAKFNALDEGQSTEYVLQGFTNSRNWYIVGFSDVDVKEKPARCLLENCLCICKRNSDVVADCNSAGFCRGLGEKDVWVYSEVLREYYYEGLPSSKYSASCVPLSGNLMSLKVQKTSDRITLSTVYGPFKRSQDDPRGLFSDYCKIV